MRKSLKFRFPNGRGQHLAGIFDLPETPPLFYGVFSPCFTCPKESHAAVKVCRALAERGVGMLRFDVTGVGESEGSFAHTGFSSYRLDIIAACHAVAAEYAEPKLLIGHSISGTAGLSAVRYLPSVQALATIGSPRDPAYTIDKFRKHSLMVEKEGGVELNVVGRRIMVRKEFIDDMLAQDVAGDTARIDRQLFIFHAPHDNIVSFENARVIYDRATCDRELVPLDEDATHLLENRPDDAVFIAETLNDWFRLHLK